MKRVIVAAVGLGLGASGLVRAEVGEALRQRLVEIKRIREGRADPMPEATPPAREADPTRDPAPPAPPPGSAPGGSEEGSAETVARPALPPFTLEQALVYARERSFLLRKLTKQLEAARAGRNAAGAYPELHLTYNANLYLRDGQGFTEEPFVGVHQILDLFGNRKAARLVAEKGVDLGKLAVRGFHQQLAYDVATGYRQLQYSKLLLQAAHFTVRLARSFLRVAKLRAEAGTVPELDVVRAQAELTRAQADRKSAEFEQVKARAALARTLGLEAWQDLRVTGTLENFKLASDYEQLLAAARSTRVDLEALRVASEKLAAERRQIRRRRKPTVTGSVQLKDDPGRPATQFGGLSIDLVPTWYGRMGNLEREKRLLEEAVAQDLLDRRRRMRIQLSEGIARVDKLRQRLNILQYQEVPRIARQLETVERGYKAGGLSNLAVLEAQRQVVQVTHRYLETLRSYHMERLLLARETGMAPVSTEKVESSHFIGTWLFGER